MESYEPGIFFPVEDATRLEGASDFKLAYNPERYAASLFMQGAANRRALADVDAPATAAEAAAPTGSISFIDALEKQLGLNWNCANGLRRSWSSISNRNLGQLISRRR